MDIGVHPVAHPLAIAIYMHDLAGGGVERMKMDLIRNFQRSGAVVTLLLHSGAGDLRGLLPDGLRVVAFGTRRTVADVVPLARFLRRERPDILLSSLDHNNVIALLAKAVALSPSKVVICQHNALSSEAGAAAGWKYRVIPRLYRWLLPLSGGLVTVSRGVADDLAKVCGIARGRISVVHNPVIGEDFASKLGGRTDHPWFGDGGPRPFVSAGRLVEQKDHETLLRAFALYLRREHGRLVILGAGPRRVALEALAAELGIGGHVWFAGFQENPIPFVRDAAAFVLSSRYEGFGNVLVEAMGCGTPVISTDCPYGPAEILGDGCYGRLVPPGDAGALAEALDPHLDRIWPPEALKARAAEYTGARSAAAYRALFERILERDGCDAG
jgi:glycosyltransferase involved in cell wall biosynthesis